MRGSKSRHERLSMSKLPAFQFYPGDWRKDTGVQSLDYQARGVWIEILCLMHESEQRGILTLNGRAMPDEALARLLGLDEILLKQILTTLVNHGVTSRDEHTGALMSRRMVRDENLRKIRQNAGKSGGNPVLLKQKPTTHLKQKSTPSSSSSSSSSDIYCAYPRKVGRKKAEAIIQSLLAKNPESFAADLLAKTKAYADATARWPAGSEQYIPHPATWFGQERFNDDPATWERKAAGPESAKPNRINFEHDKYKSF